jgi:hypothetical protein
VEDRRRSHVQQVRETNRQSSGNTLWQMVPARAHPTTRTGRAVRHARSIRGCGDARYYDGGATVAVGLTSARKRATRANLRRMGSPWACRRLSRAPRPQSRHAGAGRRRGARIPRLHRRRARRRPRRRCLTVSLSHRSVSRLCDDCHRPAESELKSIDRAISHRHPELARDAVRALDRPRECVSRPERETPLGDDGRHTNSSRCLFAVITTSSETHEQIGTVRALDPGATCPTRTAGMETTSEL